jgi:hypothetical protein
VSDKDVFLGSMGLRPFIVRRRFDPSFKVVIPSKLVVETGVVAVIRCYADITPFAVEQTAKRHSDSSRSAPRAVRRLRRLWHSVLCGYSMADLVHQRSPRGDTCCNDRAATF